MAGIDLLIGTVHALDTDRHRSLEFIEFLKLLDTAYPAATAIKVILDNHSAYISRETKTWLAAQPDGRFAFVFTPGRGSWPNLIEGFFTVGLVPGSGGDPARSSQSPEFRVSRRKRRWRSPHCRRLPPPADLSSRLRHRDLR
jgi:hypothetical protein